MQLHRTAATLLSLCASLNALALSMGQPGGSVWIGKPLNLTIPLTLDAADSASGLCAHIEGTQGESRINEQDLSVSIEPGSSSTTSLARVRSSRSIDEPFVTLTLKVGCDAPSTRRYVLFADVPTDIASPMIPFGGQIDQVEPAAPGGDKSFSAGPESSSGAPIMGGLGSVDSSGSSDSGLAGPSPAIGRDVPMSAPKRVQPRAAAKVAPKPAATNVVPAPVPAISAASAPGKAGAVTQPKAAASGPRARLQLDDLDLTPSASVGLNAVKGAAKVGAAAGAVNPASSAAAAASSPASASAAAAVTTPEPSAEAQRLEALEVTLAGLRRQMAENQRSLLDMRKDLGEARQSRYANPLTYALGLLLLLALIGLLLLWRSAQQAKAAAVWWSQGDAHAAQAAAPVVDQAASQQVPEPADNEAHVDFQPNTQPVGLYARKDELGGALVYADAPRKSVFGAPVEAPGTAPDGGIDATEELFSVEQEADFFLALGQHDQAISVLKEHIASYPTTSARAYLDVLEIYHSLDRQDDYFGLRLEFMHAFEVDLPPFEEFERAKVNVTGAVFRPVEPWPPTAEAALDPAETAPSPLELESLGNGKAEAHHPGDAAVAGASLTAPIKVAAGK